jgi:hypothetical protein
MVQFIPASELKTQFNVLGHFYTVKLTRQETLQCRSVLEIIAKSATPSQNDAVSHLKPDAVFIMMNPGSSQPLVEVDNHISREAIDSLPISLVPTKPDTTQYQVMRLMHYCHWQHVRVLNLSDLRCSKSMAFMKQFHRLEADFQYDAHSIFSTNRQRELAKKIPASNTMPIVYAWGLSEQLTPLIERCLSRMTGHRLIRGLADAAQPHCNKYRHPLPTLQRDKLLWVQRMVQCCQP